MKKIFTICLALVAMSMSAARVTSVWSGEYSFPENDGYQSVGAELFTNMNLGDYIQVTVSGITNPDGWAQINMAGTDPWTGVPGTNWSDIKVGKTFYQINDADVLASIKSGGLALQGKYYTLTDISIIDASNLKSVWSGEYSFPAEDGWQEVAASEFAGFRLGDYILVTVSGITNPDGWAQINMAGKDPWKGVPGADWSDIKVGKTFYQINDAAVLASIKSGGLALQGKYYTLTDISIPDNTLALDEEDGSKNMSLLTANNGLCSNVTINRAFTADGGWYTLCLPFDLTTEQVTATLNGTLKELDNSELNNNVLRINFKDATAVEAGKPYLFKPTEALSSLSFENVTIDATNPAPVQTTYVTMYGTYDRPQLTSEDFIIAEVSGESTLVRVENGTWIRAFRGYFTLDPTAANAAIRVVTTPGFVTGVEEAVSSPCRKQIRNGQIVIVKDNKMFNLQGVRLQ